MNIINAKDLTKKYESDGQQVSALKGISFSVGEGEFSAIAGPSGSGKTTLLNIIGGLDSPTSGDITVAGSDLNALNAKEMSRLRLMKIGFVFQAYNLIPVLSAVENVEYVLLLQGVERSERLDRSKQILSEVGLEKEMYRLPREMSGGQQQRVAIARAIVSKPAIILADEPTANLDQKTGKSLLDLMHELNIRKNITFLFSTHDQMVMERAERLIHLMDGVIVSDEKKKRSAKAKGARPRK